MMYFTQKEFELEVTKILEYGDIADISHYSGIGYKYLDSQLSPNDERKSYLFGALQIICALEATHPSRGEELWQLMTRAREMSRKTESQADLQNETAKLNQEHTDVINSVIEGKPYDQQLAELLELKAQTEVVIKATLAKLNAEKEATDGERQRLRVVSRFTNQGPVFSRK